MLSIYKDIHSHPELSTQEQRTSTIVAKELRAAGCEVTENFGTYEKPGLKCYGVVGVMKSGNGPTVLIRTDMDALPVQEQTGAPYASKVTATNNEGKEVPVIVSPMTVKKPGAINYGPFFNDAGVLDWEELNPLPLAY